MIYGGSNKNGEKSGEHFHHFFTDIFTVLKVHRFGENIHRFDENIHRFGENDENGENGYRQNLNSPSIILFGSF